MNFEHVSVMLMPTVDMLNVREGGIYVDGTLGGGGHSAACSRGRAWKSCRRRISPTRQS